MTLGISLTITTVEVASIRGCEVIFWLQNLSFVGILR
jgi:hypothetical protein